MEVARFQTGLTEFTLFLKCDVIAGSGGRMSSPLWFLATKQIEREVRNTLQTLVPVCAPLLDKPSRLAAQKLAHLC